MDIYSRRHGQHTWNAPPAGRGAKDLEWELSVDKFLNDYPPSTQPHQDLRTSTHPSQDARTSIRGEDRGTISGGKSGRLYSFYCDALKARGDDWCMAAGMVRLWELAGCDEQTLQEKVVQDRPRTKEELRLVMMKLMGRLREDQIPSKVNIGAMLDIAVDFFWDGPKDPGRGGALGLGAASEFTQGQERGRGGTMSLEERGRGGTMSLEERERGGTMSLEERGTGGIMSLEERQSSLVPLQQFVMNAISNSAHDFAGNALYVNKVSMFIQKMVSVAGYDLRSLRDQFEVEGRERAGRLLAAKLSKYEAAMPNGITIDRIVNMTTNFVSGNVQQAKFSPSDPPPFFDGHPLPNLSRPPPRNMNDPSYQDRIGPPFRRMSGPPPWENDPPPWKSGHPHRESGPPPWENGPPPWESGPPPWENGPPPWENGPPHPGLSVMGSVQDQVSRAVMDRFQPPHKGFMGGGFQSRNHSELGPNYGGGFERTDRFEEFRKRHIRSRSPWRSRSPGGRDDLRGRLPSKNDRKLDRKDLDKEMDEWRKEKERLDRKSGHREKNLQKSLDAELDELAAKRKLIKKKKEANKDVEIVDLDLPTPCSVLDPSKSKKKVPEDEDIDCITLD